LKTSVIVFPFDLFGSGGSAEGAVLLADELREILADNRRERVATRARVYSGHVRLRQTEFETLDAYADWRRQGRLLARVPLRQGDFLLFLTGNHLGCLPVYDELSGRDGTLVVQLDAHLDIHHFHDTTTELSHGNFLLHCAGPLPAVINVGHRDLLLDADYVRKHFRDTMAAPTLAREPARVLDQVGQAVGRAERVVVDIDCDVFDPAYFPAVTRPVPFGLTPPQVLGILEMIPPTKLAGVLVSEFEPGRDQNDRSLAIVVWLLEYLLLRRYEPRE
jgi:agmatinase